MQEVDIAEGLYVNYVRVGPLTGELEATWEVVNNAQWKVRTSKGTYDFAGTPSLLEVYALAIPEAVGHADNRNLLSYLEWEVELETTVIRF